MFKKIGFSALSLFFFVVLAIAVMMVTDIFFNKQDSFFQRNEHAIEKVVTQLEDR